MGFRPIAAIIPAALAMSVVAMPGTAEASTKPTKSLTKMSYEYARALASGNADKIEKYLMDTKKCIRQAQSNADGISDSIAYGFPVTVKVKSVKQSGKTGTVKIRVNIYKPDGSLGSSETTATKWKIVGKKWLKTCQ